MESNKTHQSAHYDRRIPPIKTRNGTLAKTKEEAELFGEQLAKVLEQFPSHNDLNGQKTTLLGIIR